jgi:hypothetical protein
MALAEANKNLDLVAEVALAFDLPSRSHLCSNTACRIV